MTMKLTAILIRHKNSIYKLFALFVHNKNRRRTSILHIAGKVKIAARLIIRKSLSHIPPMRIRNLKALPALNQGPRCRYLCINIQPHPNKTINYKNAKEKNKKKLYNVLAIYINLFHKVDFTQLQVRLQWQWQGLFAFVFHKEL